MSKTIETLVADIYALFTEGHVCDPENTAALGQAIAEVVQARLQEAAKAREPFRLRMSNLGKQDKQLWYEARREQFPSEPLEAPTRIKFLFGDILERVLLFLTVEAGHELTHSQRQVEVDGITGSMDGRIDGVLVDVKSASTFSFQKFKTGELRRDDPFGYMWQLSGYSTGDTPPETDPSDGAFLAIDKTLGHICLMKVPSEEFKLYDVPQRIDHLKSVIMNPEPPGRCYDDVPDGKSGNMKLATGCSYCSHKSDCWPDLKTYFYASGPRFLTTVVREPKVEQQQSD